MDRKWMTADSIEYELLKENARGNRKNMTEAESIFWSLVKGGSLGQRCLRQRYRLRLCEADMKLDVVLPQQSN